MAKKTKKSLPALWAEAEPLGCTLYHHICQLQAREAVIQVNQLRRVLHEIYRQEQAKTTSKKVKKSLKSQKTVVT